MTGVSAILQYLTYCHLVWNFCKSSDNRKIEHILERALRAVYRSKSQTCEELLTRTELPILNNRRLQDIATLMCKVKNELIPSCVSELFNVKDSQLTTALETVSL